MIYVPAIIAFILLFMDVPVGLSQIILFSCPSVNRNGFGSGGSGGTCDLNGIYMPIVKAFSYLYGDGFGYRMRDRLHYTVYKVGIFHEIRTFVVVDHLRNGTSHVDIKYRKWLILYLCGDLGHEMRIVSEKLE